MASPSTTVADGSSPAAAQQQQPLFYVTRKSQEPNAPEHRKLRYVGIRNLSDLDKIQEEDIIGPKGTIRGVKNRVRAGLANYENPTAIQKVSMSATYSMCANLDLAPNSRKGRGYVVCNAYWRPCRLVNTRNISSIRDTHRSRRKAGRLSSTRPPSGE